MSQLNQLTTSDIWCPDEGSVMPGKWVKHVQDDKSYGLVVGRVGVDVSVLWSTSPKGVIQVDVQPIHATPRKLNVKWSVADDLYAMRGIDGECSIVTRQPMYEVEEEYEFMHYDEVQRLHQDGAHVQLHNDGHVTVNRRTHEPPPEGYDHERIRRRRVSIGRY